MHLFSVFRIGVSLTTCLAVPALAQDLDRGKSPSQIFSSNCTACHRGPQGLSRAGNASATATFLRDHYTTSAESAGAIAAYLAAVGGDPRTARLRQPTAEAPDQAQRGTPAQSPDGGERRERAAAREDSRVAAPRAAVRKRGEPATVSSDPSPVITSSAPIALEQDRVPVLLAPARQGAVAAPAGPPSREPATTARETAPVPPVATAANRETLDNAASASVPAVARSGAGETGDAMVVPPAVDLDAGVQEGFSSPLP